MDKKDLSARGVERGEKVERIPMPLEFQAALSILMGQGIEAFQDDKKRKSLSPVAGDETEKSPLTIDDETRWAAKMILQHFGDPKGENFAKKLIETSPDGNFPDWVVPKVLLAVLWWYRPGKELNRKALFGAVLDLLDDAPSKEFSAELASNLAVLDSRYFFERCLSTLQNSDSDAGLANELHRYIRKVVDGLPRNAFSDPLLAELWVAAHHKEHGILIPPGITESGRYFEWVKKYADADEGRKGNAKG